MTNNHLTCPVCERTSFSPADILNSWCGYCSRVIRPVGLENAHWIQELWDRARLTDRYFEILADRGRFELRGPVVPASPNGPSTNERSFSIAWYKAIRVRGIRVWDVFGQWRGDDNQTWLQVGHIELG